MKKCFLLLFFLLILPCQALADSLEDFYLSCSCRTIRAVTTYSRKQVPSADNPDTLIWAYTPLGSISSGTYLKWIESDKENKKALYKYYRNGSYHTDWIEPSFGNELADTTTPIYFINEESTLYAHHYIVSNPARLAEWMARMAPGRAYTTIPPWQWDENPPEVNVSTPTPAPTEETTDAPSATQKPTGNTSSATKKPSSTKKPSATKQAKATATPAPTAAPSPEGWLDATWIADNLDPACTENREISVVQLGVSESVVILGEEEITVPTKALTFAEGVKDKHRIAAIYAPRLGRCILRAKASEKAKELDKCPAGRIVPVLEYGKTWTKIRYEGQVGYVKTAVLTFLGNKADPIGVGVTSYQGRATGSAKVPLRNGKTSDAEIILNLRTATEVKVLSFDGKWYELEHDGWYGFLYKTYFTYEDE